MDFHVTDERGKVLGYRNLSELRRRLAPVMLRRDRRLVRDQLPERIEQRLDVPLTPPQRVCTTQPSPTPDVWPRSPSAAPSPRSEQQAPDGSLQQARMACNAAGLVDKETEGSPKLDELATLLEELCVQGGLKVVVFSQWERMTAMVEDLVRRLDLGFVRLHGGVPTAKRGELIDRFRDDDSVQVFVSTDAGGTGLNLQHASVLINLDVPWNPAVLDQRIARVHRLGQKQRVQIILMVAADSYEQQVLALVRNKRNLFDNVVNPEATEDVVGVSRKLVEILAADLAGLAEVRRGADPQEAGEASTELPAEEPRPVAPSAAGEPAESTESTRPRSRSATPSLPHRTPLGRASSASSGLVVGCWWCSTGWTRPPTGGRGHPGRIPVALIDPRTLGGLAAGGRLAGGRCPDPVRALGRGSSPRSRGCWCRPVKSCVVLRF